MDVGTALDAELVQRLRQWFGPERADQFASLFRSFDSEAETMIEAMAQEARGDDRSAVVRLAHKLLGSSSTVGARSIAEWCARIDGEGESTSGDLSEMVTMLASEQRRFSAELQTFLATMTNG